MIDSEDPTLTPERRAYLRAHGRSFVFHGERVYVDTHGVYRDGSQAVRLVTWDGEPYATLSVYLVDTPVPHPSYFWAKTWSENAEIAGAALHARLFHDSGKVAPAGYALAELWKLNDDWDLRMAAEALGVTDTFDTALPQGWVDELRAFVRTLPTGDTWDPFGQYVWLYDKESPIFGRPFPLTPDADSALQLYIESKGDK